MSELSWSKRIKGAVGNAFVFGAGWFVAGFLVWLGLRQAHFVPPLSVMDGIGMAIKVGVMGFIAGAVFPSIMRLAYRGKRLSEISWLKFGLVGGLVTGLFVPALMQSFNLLNDGRMVPFALIRGDIVIAALFGGLAAAFSLRLAQYADKLFPETFQYHLDRLETQTALTAGESQMPSYSSRAKEHSALPRHDR